MRRVARMADNSSSDSYKSPHPNDPFKPSHHSEPFKPPFHHADPEKPPPLKDRSLPEAAVPPDEFLVTGPTLSAFSQSKKHRRRSKTRLQKPVVEVESEPESATPRLRRATIGGQPRRHFPDEPAADLSPAVKLPTDNEPPKRRFWLLNLFSAGTARDRSFSGFSIQCFLPAAQAETILYQHLTQLGVQYAMVDPHPVSYTHLRAHET